jgi:4-amino-4-deoxy-L-arabinose transferase-like glycosyltransferase
MRRAMACAIAVIVLAASGLALAASRRNSLTFDESFIIAVGARGLVTGDYSVAYEHPPGMLMIYGAAARAAGIRLPSERQSALQSTEVFNYGQDALFRSGNDPERIAFAARIVAMLFAMGLGLAVATFAWRRAGPRAALFATTMVMLMPDIMAHAGIAYGDLPSALLFLLGLWAWDLAVRNPTARTAIVAAVVTGLALSVKFNALALGPAALVLTIVEGIRRRGDTAWMRRVGKLLPLATVVVWAVLVVTYRGDLTLGLFRQAIANNLSHVAAGHGAPTLLLGRISNDGFWYFFPVALLLKTPAAFHGLALLAIAGCVIHWQATGMTWRAAIGHPLRMLPIAIALYVVILLRAKLNIGVRHAMPLLPLLALATGIGIDWFWRRAGRAGRGLVAAGITAFSISTLVYYPWFLTYLTEYVPDRRSAAHRVMVDSNLDWGQGLLALREFMRRENVPAVYLSYFGSAVPEGYGIRYVAMRSFFPLLKQPVPASSPEWVVISATNLAGVYMLPDDPYREFRSLQPHRVLGNSLYAYRIGESKR